MRRLHLLVAAVATSLIAGLGATLPAAALTPATDPSPGATAPATASPTATTSAATTPATTPAVSPAVSTIGGEQLAVKGKQVNLLPGATPLPKIQAKAWVIADAQTGAILASKNAHLQRPPASTLKMLTALTTLPNLDLDATYTAKVKDVYADGTRVGLIAGKPYPINDLFYALFLKSGNDAAKAIARANGGVQETVTQMNAVAASLQAYDTVAKTPSGLDRPGQVSSAYDLALIARAGLARADFSHYASTIKHEFPTWKGKKQRKAKTFTIYTQNRMLLRGVDGAIGVKTGFTTDAGRTFVGAATRDGRTLIVALLGVKEHTDVAAEKALDWGFANVDTVQPVGELVGPAAAAAATALTVVASASPSPSQPAMSDAELAAAGIAIGATNEIEAPLYSWIFLGLVIFGAFALLVRHLLKRRQHPGAAPTIGTAPTHERIRLRY